MLRYLLTISGYNEQIEHVGDFFTGRYSYCSPAY